MSSKLSREGRSDTISKRRPSRLSRSGFIRFSSENDLHFSEKNSPKKACLENACLFWLVMLYYKRSRLNGLGSPSGIETQLIRHQVCLPADRLNGLGSPSGIETNHLPTDRNCLFMAKWPGEPVRD